MGHPGVSIIIPTYESLDLLHRTVATTLLECQSAGGDWEVIAVDNESREELTDRLRTITAEAGSLRVIRRTGLGGRHFQPGAARNIGIAIARFDVLIFLDADCLPTPGLVRRYRALASRFRGTVFLGHRVFVDASGLSGVRPAEDRRLLSCAPPVASRSNYGQSIDRRIAELRALEEHPCPYNCLHSCNFALHRACLGAERFDPVFDGYWGYEDIELGYRLFRNGRSFRYVPQAFVYHQEGGTLSDQDRMTGRERNFWIAAQRIPGFLNYRRESRRIESVPRGRRLHETVALRMA
jgi:glycosyltransferase involved in cell wall biosynthesis